MDNYLRTASQGDIAAGQRDPNVYDAGLTVGVLPFERVNAEVGVDYIANGTGYDTYPFYFNAKLGVPERLSRHSELRVIEYVEKLRPELQPELTLRAEVKLLEQRHVELR